MSSVADAIHNRAYLVLCPHPEKCEFGCAPIDGKQLISQEQWESIKSNDVMREAFKEFSAEKFGKIITLSID